MYYLNKYDLNKTRYTHRDYETIKADLIDAIPSLTQEWTSTEDADPGIVLIKLMSMFGDTLSFNVDKIALELYIQSVTQRKNCAKILSLLGYKMHWYRSGRVTAHVCLKVGQDYNEKGYLNHVILTPFKTTCSAGDITYCVALQGQGSDQIDISSSTETTPVNLIQGIPSSETFSGVNLINNRYYLKTYNVDESEFLLEIDNTTTMSTRDATGKVISNTSTRTIKCKFVDNLYLITDSNTVYYTFGVDEYDRPYIELVDNWTDIVKSSTVKFKIFYIVSNGALGNITSNAFTKGFKNADGTSGSEVVIVNLANNTKYGDDLSNLVYDPYNSSGYHPQTVEEAKKDSANYVFTLDSLVTSFDYEKAAKRLEGITVSKLVDAQVVINDSLDLNSISQRAWDNFDTIEVKDEVSTTEPDKTEDKQYLAPHQVILYVAYRNFDANFNQYYNNTYITEPKSLWKLSGDDPYGSSYDSESSKINKEGAGYYPYKPLENILLSVRDLISNLHTLNVRVDFGTIKLFPFKVMGTLHLVEPMSPAETLQIVDAVDKELVKSYYPSTHPIGEKPNFIELVDIIQKSDPRIKYFDAIGSIVEWAPAINQDDFDKIFDTTSAIMYNGLSDRFNLHKSFLKFKLRNVGATYTPDDFVYPENSDAAVLDTPPDYGTAYLFQYSSVLRKVDEESIGKDDVIKIGIGQTVTLELKNIDELRALVEDMRKAFYHLEFKEDNSVDKEKSFKYNNLGLRWMR